MKIAVLSGKGGTGKTFISTNLAASLDNALYCDFDVEEPNGHLFFKPDIVEENNVWVMNPHVKREYCTGCRECVRFCKFNALAYIGGRVKVFEDVCHSCGGCVLFCPQKAIVSEDKKIGIVQKAKHKQTEIITGFLKEGEESGVAIISQCKENFKETNKNVIIDCPPGSSCVVMDSIKDVDYCILVAEPTLFGLHNLKMVHELVNVFNKPCGVILNKCIDDDNPSKEYCVEKNIRILKEIKYTNELAKMISQGILVVEDNDVYKDLFLDIFAQVSSEVQL